MKQLPARVARPCRSSAWACWPATAKARAAGIAAAAARGAPATTPPKRRRPPLPGRDRDHARLHDRHQLPAVRGEVPGAGGRAQALCRRRARRAAAGRARRAEAGADAAPYDLSLSFTELLDSPTLVAVAADGSSYTGGAHGAPLIARFVWLPQQQPAAHRAATWCPMPRAGTRSPRYVREQLHTALSQRVDADELPPEERVEVVKSASRMIDDGTEPEPEQLRHVRAGGRRRRASCAPCGSCSRRTRSGPYSDGTQTVEVPAAVLLPHIAPAYRRPVPGRARRTRPGGPRLAAMSATQSSPRARDADPSVPTRRRAPAGRGRRAHRRRPDGGLRDWDLRDRTTNACCARLLAQGSLGLGESYMDGWWDAPSLDGLLFHLLDAAHRPARARHRGLMLDALRADLFNLQSRQRAASWSASATTTSATTSTAPCSASAWSTAAATGAQRDTLDEAQEAKLDLVCRKLGLQPGMRVLDIGCGWGEALKFAAERYGVSGVGVTISHEQADVRARTVRRPADRDPRAGLPRSCRRNASTAVFSLGMFEHVGVKNYRTLLRGRARAACSDGWPVPAAHHRQQRLASATPTRGSRATSSPTRCCRRPRRSRTPCEGLFVIEDWHGFGPDYDRTLQAWRDNIERAWPTLPTRYDERFRRMWRYLPGRLDGHASAAAARSSGSGAVAARRARAATLQR